ncbi:MAG: WYL domain-containing protein [bacterium]|nr:WYL domain-containing protein [bacterium]
MATHLKYISDQKFNSSFKNMLRDYYTYGFKDREEYSGSLGTYNNDQKRLNDFLKDYMEWSNQKKRKSVAAAGKNVTFITCDSQSMSMNPFHRVYRFCGTDRPEYLYYFFHTIATLDSSFQLAEGTDTLALYGNAAARLESKLNVQEKQIIRTVKSMHVGQRVETRLQQYYNNEELLIEVAKDEFRFSEEQILKLKTAIRSTAIKLKTSELAKFYVQKPLAEKLIGGLKIREGDKERKIRKDEKEQLLVCLSDKEVFCQTAKAYGLTDKQIAMVQDAIPETMIDVINSMNLDKNIARCLRKNSKNRKQLIEESRKSGLSEDLIERLTYAFDVRKTDQNTVSTTVNNRLQRLSEIGVVHCSQKGGERVFSDKQVKQVMDAVPDVIKRLLETENMTKLFEQSLKNYSTEKPGDRSWYLSGLTLKRLLEAGQAVNNQFHDHFQYALDFYSKTFLFGEIGTFLLDRMGTRDDSPIRIKHEYYMHSLNDFNAIDLMAAIENKKWCLISYKREKMETTLLCYPIELRISSTNGREYLMYYEPFKKSCAALRLEFIESIQYYHDYDVKKCLSKYYPDTEVNIDIERNLSRAKLLMDYTWGVSTGIVQERNVESLKTMFRELRVRIAYNKDSDYYILNRLYRESRIGIICVNEKGGYIDFSVVAADINEVIPFIRSFYSRVISCTGFDQQDFSIEMDIKHIDGQMIDKEMEIEKKNEENNSEGKIWRIDDAFLKALGHGMKANAHEKLFHEIFSTYYHIFAAIFSEICNGTQDYTETEIQSLCKTMVYRYKEKCGSEMVWMSFGEGNVFVDMLKNGGFLLKEEQNGKVTYKSKYETASFVDLYRDVIPLSEMEVRWLKTIIRDEKIHYFLDEKEIVAVKLLLAEMAIDSKPFPMEAVNYYDRYKFSPKKEWKESAVLVPILDAIRNNQVVKIKYVSSKKHVVSGNYKPILVEYSKRDNCFRGYFLSCRKKEGMKVYNLAQCSSVENTGKRFDDMELRTFFDTYRDQQMDKVEIAFEDRPKLADRILTEFSPWKKRCEFDSESGMYYLTIYYQKQDGKEMALRLLGLGEKVRLVDSEHSISKIVKSKLRDQREQILKESQKTARGRERTDSTR